MERVGLGVAAYRTGPPFGGPAWVVASGCAQAGENAAALGLIAGLRLLLALHGESEAPESASRAAFGRSSRPSMRSDGKSRPVASRAANRSLYTLFSSLSLVGRAAIGLPPGAGCCSPAAHEELPSMDAGYWLLASDVGHRFGIRTLHSVADRYRTMADVQRRTNGCHQKMHPSRFATGRTILHHIHRCIWRIETCTKNEAAYPDRMADARAVEAVDTADAKSPYREPVRREAVYHLRRWRLLVGCGISAGPMDDHGNNTV